MNISKSGVYFHSKLHNSQARRFGSAKRSTFSTKNRSNYKFTKTLDQEIIDYLANSDIIWISQHFIKAESLKKIHLLTNKINYDLILFNKYFYYQFLS